MLTFLIILAAWITPGVLLFLYLFWIIKRGQRQGAQLELPLTEPAGPPAANNDTRQFEMPQSVAAGGTSESHQRSSVSASG
jgi:hypothetical protein